MSVQFGGIASGLDVNSIINALISVDQKPIDMLTKQKDNIVAQQSQYQAVSSRVTDLLNSLNTLTDANLGTSFDLFSSKSASSSNANAVAATVTNDATTGSFSVDVKQLATATQAASLSQIGQYTTGASAVNTIAQGSVSKGNFTVYVNNQAATIAVDPTTDTAQSILDKVATQISTITGQSASGTMTADGKFQLTYAAGTNVQFGATGDTSNFAKVTGLATGSANTNKDTFTASFGTSTINLQGTLVGNAVGLQNNTIKAGTFTLGGATFTVDATTTLADLMSQINSNTQAGVMVSYNPTTNKIQAVAKDTGNQAITMNDNGTGVLQSLGLVNGTDTLSSQTIGQNAQLTINGGNILQSMSNSVDESVTALTGVTLNMLSTTTSSSGDTPATVTVSQDNSKLTNAVNTFISNFNQTISFIDEQTAKGAILDNDTSLISLRNQLMSTVTDAVSNPNITTYKTLTQVGISTGAPTATPTAGQAPSMNLVLDASALTSALATNPSEVKKLFIGDGTNNGIITNLENIVNGSLDPQYGMFTAFNNSSNDEIQSINNTITRDTDMLNQKETEMRNEFNAMDQMVSQFKSQQSSISNIGK